MRAIVLLLALIVPGVFGLTSHLKLFDILPVNGAILVPKYESLARRWAPVICQDIDNENTRAEYITRFDYDGVGTNWRGNDNWDNIYNYDLPAYVYYWVVETETHYFIGYAFYHPRDWSSLASGNGEVLEHENDLEGILLTIQKSSDPAYSYGKFMSMVTVAHTNFFSYTEQNTGTGWDGFTSPSVDVIGGHEDIDGDVDFVVDDYGFHPAIYIQAEAHGAFGIKGGSSLGGYGITDSPPIFDDNKITDWLRANWLGIVYPPKSGNPSQSYDTSDWGPWYSDRDGIIYHYEDVADIPTREKPLPRSWQVVGYHLVSIKSLWDRRYDYEKPYKGETETKVTFENYGTFDGNNGDDDACNSPWGWNDGNDGPVYPPDFFVSPAYLVDYYFDGLGSFSKVYVDSSLVDEDGYVLETKQPYQGEEDRWGDWEWKVMLEDAEKVTIYVDKLSIHNTHGFISLLDGHNYPYTTLHQYFGQVDVAEEKIDATTNYVIITARDIRGESGGEWGFRIRIVGKTFTLPEGITQILKKIPIIGSIVSVLDNYIPAGLAGVIFILGMSILLALAIALGLLRKHRKKGGKKDKDKEH